MHCILVNDKVHVPGQMYEYIQHTIRARHCEPEHVKTCNYERNLRHCEERSDEAIQENAEITKSLDCFANAQRLYVDRAGVLTQSGAKRSNPALTASENPGLLRHCVPRNDWHFVTKQFRLVHMGMRPFASRKLTKYYSVCINRDAQGRVPYEVYELKLHILYS